MRVTILGLLFVGASANDAVSANAPSTPVGRVVQLMENLHKQIEDEGKKEEDLYETYVCWAKSIINSKTESNAAAGSRIHELEKYIADIAAGRVEFTSERVDLTKELEELNADIEAATAMREREKADFESASHEMDLTIAALQSAIEVLKEATAAHAQGTMLIAQDSSGQREASSAAALSRAVELGQRFLTKGDAMFLRRLFSGEVPTADWKKLNRKATFKMNYKARSGKIQAVLASLLATFEANLLEATQKEANAQSTYDKLMETKNSQKESTEEALLRMDKENGAASMTSEEAQAEVDALTTQVSDDTNYIAQVEKSLAEKEEEWKARQILRAGELAAISKAIGILYSDDARDLMKKSYKSQGFSLVQTSADSDRGTAVAAILRQTAHGADAKRRGSLLALAARATAPSHFKAVVTAIDNMVAVLQAEEAEDLEIKERCESDRARDAREAAVTSREIDEMTDKIAKLRADIEELKAVIVDKQQQIKDNQEELAEATKIREAEQAQYEQNKKFDEDTHALIISSRAVLTKFYSENGLMLMLVQKRAQQPGGVAGEAPPPPPPTWEAPYGGKVDESTGVIAILGMLAEDVEKDMAASTSAENEAIAAYEKTKSAIEASIASLEADIVALGETQSEKEEDIVTTKGDRRESKKALAAVMDTLAKAAPGCDFFAVNYEVRLQNRQVELDGLQKAKAILEGAAFTKPNEGRELKPGDAFFQRVELH